MKIGVVESEKLGAGVVVAVVEQLVLAVKFLVGYYPPCEVFLMLEHPSVRYCASLLAIRM